MVSEKVDLGGYDWEADSIPTDVDPTNVVLTEIHVDRYVIKL